MIQAKFSSFSDEFFTLIRQLVNMISKYRVADNWTELCSLGVCILPSHDILPRLNEIQSFLPSIYRRCQVVTNKLSPHYHPLSWG